MVKCLLLLFHIVTHHGFSSLSQKEACIFLSRELRLWKEHLVKCVKSWFLQHNFDFHCKCGNDEQHNICWFSPYVPTVPSLLHFIHLRWFNSHAFGCGPLSVQFLSFFYVACCVYHFRCPKWNQSSDQSGWLCSLGLLGAVGSIALVLQDLDAHRFCTFWRFPLSKGGLSITHQCIMMDFFDYWMPSGKLSGSWAAGYSHVSFQRISSSSYTQRRFKSMKQPCCNWCSTRAFLQLWCSGILCGRSCAVAQGEEMEEGEEPNDKFCVVATLLSMPHFQYPSLPGRLSYNLWNYVVSFLTHLSASADIDVPLWVLQDSGFSWGFSCYGLDFGACALWCCSGWSIK